MEIKSPLTPLLQRGAKDKTNEIKDILNRVIGDIKKHSSGRNKRIIEGWKEMVGEDIDRHSRPVSIRRNILIVEVDSSPWLYEISLRKKILLEEINKILDKEKIGDIRFRIGGWLGDYGYGRKI